MGGTVLVRQSEVGTVSAVEQLVRAVRRRERLRDVSHALSRVALPVGLLVAAAVLVGIRRAGLDPRWLWLSGLSLPVAIAWGLHQRRSWRATARKIDQHFGLHDRIGSAWELRRTPADAFADSRAATIAALAIEQGEATAANLNAAEVVPLRAAPLRKVEVLALVALCVALLLPQEQEPIVIAGTPRQPARGDDGSAAKARAVDIARTEPLRQTLRELIIEGEKPSELAAGILEVLEQLGEGALDRNAALAELERLEVALADLQERFDEQLTEDPETLAEALRDLAEALEDNEGMERVAQALSDRDPAAVDESLQEAEARDRELQQALQEMERRLEQAAKKESDSKKALDEAERRLRRAEREKPDAQDPAEQERRLQKQRERVEQLRRQHEREQAARDALERLRRQAQQAASGGASGSQQQQQQRQEAMDQLRQGLRDSAAKVRRSSQLKRLSEAMDEAKSFVRRAGNKGEASKQRDEQFRRFSKAARGDRDKSGKGKNGQQNKTTLIVEGKVDDPDMVLTDESGQGDGREGPEGDGQGNGDSASQMPGGDGMGDGSSVGENDKDLKNAQFKDVRVDARGGQGATRAEIIRDSSQNGFAGESYRETFQDYRDFAQSALDSEAMPAQARRTVRRYYQLISPRQ